MIALALAAALFAQDVAEQEPNNDREKATQELAPGGALTGSLDPEGDQDWFHVVCDKDTVCSLALEIPEGDSARLEIHLATKILSTPSGDGTLVAKRVLFPKGRTALLLVGHAKRYRCAITAEEKGERREFEPDNDIEEAHEIRLGETWRGENSGFSGELDCYVFKAASAGPVELVLKCLPRKEGPFHGYIGVFGADPLKQAYYYITDLADEFHFYPVLEVGTWNFHFTIGGDTPAGSAYEISVKPMGGKVTEAERKAAQAAIDRAVKYLSVVPEDPPSHVITAADSMVLAALSEGAGAKERREALDRDFVSRLESRFQKVEGGSVFWVDFNNYTHAMATLGLAEAAANGSEKAKALAIKAAEFLVAIQNTERKPAVWKGPIGRKARGHGGWRYSVEDPTSDLSVVGWCIIALTAVDAAGIQVEGLRDAIEKAIQYAGTVGNEKGFGYEEPQGSGSNIHNSIGGLLMLLYGIECPALRFATNELDHGLWSATQVDRGESYPFYYLYYATRAQYLRGGDVWETWRATALRQLLRRQKEDGSWAAIGYENQTGPRWTTAVGLMMVRLCLNEPPKYLRVEAKGF